MRASLLIGCIVICALTFLAAAIGSMASVQAADFYKELDRPSWAPSGKVFGPVWSVLYCTMAISACLVWRTESPSRGPALAAYASQLALNSLWSWIFFAWKSGSWAFAEVILLALFVLLTIILFWRVQRVAALLLIPYFLWVLFASCLTYACWQLNSDML